MAVIPRDEDTALLAPLAADQVLMALMGGVERKGFAYIELDREQETDPQLWLYAFPGGRGNVARAYWLALANEPVTGEVVFFISETPPFSQDFTAVFREIAQREGGCGIPPCSREEALLALVAHKNRVGRRA